MLDTPNSFIIGAAVHILRTRLAGDALGFTLLVVLAMSWMGESSECTRSITGLAEDLGCVRRVVEMRLKRLEQAGLVTIRHARGRGKTSSYSPGPTLLEVAAELRHRAASRADGKCAPPFAFCGEKMRTDTPAKCARRMPENAHGCAHGRKEEEWKGKGGATPPPELRPETDLATGIVSRILDARRSASLNTAGFSPARLAENVSTRLAEEPRLLEAVQRLLAGPDRVAVLRFDDALLAAPGGTDRVRRALEEIDALASAAGAAPARVVEVVPTYVEPTITPRREVQR